MISVLRLLLSALVLCPLGWLIFMHQHQSVYDTGHPDYQYYATVFDRLSAHLQQSDPSTHDTVDLSKLNGGKWQLACLFGGYTNPIEEIAKFGADIDQSDRLRLTNAGGQGSRLEPVEEFEMVIAYVGTDNRAKFIRFRRGFGPHGQNYRKCISKPDTELVLFTP